VESEAGAAETRIPWNLRLNVLSYFWLKLKPWLLMLKSI